MVDKSESQNNRDIGAEVTDSSSKLSPDAVLDAEAGGEGGDGEAPVPAPAAPTGCTVAGEKRRGGSGNVSHGGERVSKRGWGFWDCLVISLKQLTGGPIDRIGCNPGPSAYFRGSMDFRPSDPFQDSFTSL